MQRQADGTEAWQVTLRNEPHVPLECLRGPHARQKNSASAQKFEMHWIRLARPYGGPLQADRARALRGDV